MNCPNHTNCQLIHENGFLDTEEIKQFYLNQFCTSSNEDWHSCKRFETGQRLKFCPDFVLPDTALTVDEIIDHFEEELNLT